MKHLGCAYYPEYWGVDRVETDAKLMRDAGINLVRIGEFAWSRMEPTEGNYTLDWLHESAEIMARYGINVLMCTPTPTPPAWLTLAYPETLLMRATGLRWAHGSRRHYCSTSPTYRQHSARIAAKLGFEMAKHANVIGWQIDNELGPEAGNCYCDSCQSRFREWLQDRYESVEGLNAAWKTGFWSVDYSAWDEVRLAEDNQEPYSSRKLDSKRFWSDMMIEYGLAQASVLREHHPGSIVTTNGMGPIFTPIDYYKLFGQLDVACDDLYFDIATMDASVAAMNIYRNYKPGKKFWITETGSGALDHNKPPTADQFRAWAWSAYSHGCDAWVVFRWRTCLSGHEQELQGIIEHSGKPRHRYAAVQRLFKEMRQVTETLGDLPMPKADVAILNDYDVIWGYEASRMNTDVALLPHIYALHKMLFDQNVRVDFIPPDRELDGYKLLILPTTVILNEKLASRLRKFVEGGGVVFATGQLGMRDANDNYFTEPGPHGTNDVFGINIEGGMYLTSHVNANESLWVPAANKGKVEVPLTGTLGGNAIKGTANGWIADLTLNGATTLLHFGAEAYNTQPAVVEKRSGKGAAIFVAALGINAELLESLVSHALSSAGVAVGPKTPPYVEVVRRGNVTLAINHTAQPAEVSLPTGGKVIVGERSTTGGASLGPFGVCIVRD